MPRVSNDNVQSRLDENYDGRITLIGTYWSRQMPVLCFCDTCGEAFRQKAESLFRSRRTRCRCTWDSKQVVGRRRGHTCVPDWDLSDKAQEAIEAIRARKGT